MARGPDWVALGGKTCPRADARETAIGARTSRAGRAAASGRPVRPGHNEALAVNPSEEPMMSTDTATTGILAEDNRAKREEILEMRRPTGWRSRR
jgi:hypothetical protein